MNSPLPALLRTDLRYFVWKVFSTVLPGTTYLPNWHIDAIVHQRSDKAHYCRKLFP